MTDPGVFDAAHRPMVAGDPVRHPGAHSYRLIDKADPEANPNLEFLIADAACTIAALRDEGHRVLVHCVAGQSRTPTVAITYAMHRGFEREVAYRSISAALPTATPNTAFRAALKRLSHDAALAEKSPTH